MWKGYHFLIEGIRKGYLFREKLYIKGYGVGPRGGTSPHKSLLSTLRDPRFTLYGGTWSRIPIIRTFKGNRKKFELSRVKYIAKDPRGTENCFELAGGSSYRDRVDCMSKIPPDNAKSLFSTWGNFATWLAHFKPKYEWWWSLSNVWPLRVYGPTFFFVEKQIVSHFSMSNDICQSFSHLDRAFYFFCLVILKDLVLHTTSYSMIQGTIVRK